MNALKLIQDKLLSANVGELSSVSATSGEAFMADNDLDPGGRPKPLETSVGAETEEVRAVSIQELITVVQSLPMKGSGWLYRGQPDRSYKLIPKAGRPPFQGIDDLVERPGDIVTIQ